MGFAIPKLQYKNIDTTGNTLNTNATISNIPDTSKIEVGMFVRGAGIPDGQTVASKTSSTVVMTPGVAGATATATPIYFGYEIVFAYPPKEQKGERKKSNATTSLSLSGIRQTSVDFISADRNPVFSFVSETIKTALDTFLETSAMLGNSFRYFEDQTSNTYVEYEMDVLDYEPRKIASKGVDVYVWEIPLKFTRNL